MKQKNNWYHSKKIADKHITHSFMINKNIFTIEYDEGSDIQTVIEFLLEKTKLQEILGCKYLVSNERSRSIAKYAKIIQKKPDYWEFYSDVHDVIDTFEDGKEFHQNTIRAMLGLFPSNDGGRVRLILDFMHCQGIIRKTRFKLGRGGHMYKKERWVCKHWDKIKEKCIKPEEDEVILEREELQTGG